MEREFYSTTELSEFIGMNPGTTQVYLTRGVLPEPELRIGGRRAFSKREVKKIKQMLTERKEKGEGKKMSQDKQDNKSSGKAVRKEDARFVEFKPKHKPVGFSLAQIPEPIRAKLLEEESPVVCPLLLNPVQQDKDKRVN